MNENLSRLMDGELEPSEVDSVCAALKRADAVTTWTCYHMIGETLRGTPVATIAVREAFAARLATEPTVLAPRARPPSSSGLVTWGFAAAATVAAVTVVGWTAMSVVGDPPAAVAKAGEASAISAARVRPSTIPADYLLAHQEYAPGAIQGVGPYLRAVGTQVSDAPSDQP